PLVVQTLGRRPVRVTATAYAVLGDKITTPQPIPLADASLFYPLRTLNGLSYSDPFRTNIGLVNLGEKEAIFTLALQNGDGTTAGATRAVVPPNSMWHMAIQLLFPSMAMGD